LSEQIESHLTPLLQVEKLSIFYDHIQAAWDISFSVNEGSITALLGSNGAGKSAIMKVVSGILPVGGGHMLFDNTPLDDVAPHSRVERGIALIPEGRKVFPQLTVLENLRIGAYNRRARPTLEATLAEVLQIFPPLEARKKQLAGSLSGGEQQMLAIGRGLMSRPRLLMLDEPSLGLAPIMVQRVFEVIERINAQGVTILLVEQNVRHTLRVAHMAYILETGRITLQGPGKELLDDPHVKKAYLGL
jgi:branched-chain amino acid transport system ATP-binding protein